MIPVSELAMGPRKFLDDRRRALADQRDAWRAFARAVDRVAGVASA